MILRYLRRSGLSSLFIAPIVFFLVAPAVSLAQNTGSSMAQSAQQAATGGLTGDQRSAPGSGPSLQKRPNSWPSMCAPDSAGIGLAVDSSPISNTLLGTTKFAS